ncbi:hypothetical protein O181_044432 [Austropuccinia psidii MF-1]|uniref:Uncharacterized protein n=1 Tax=Austropuccinia psidii MF-1 TaxID=1389203 RepID=A0A9Q3HHR9_9BASI|nr:hypothetical protein [Austropuccinia psidii MF-1]
MGFKCKRRNQPNPLRQDSPIPSLPCKQTPRQPTPGPSGTQWSEDLFHEPSQPNEPPITGLSPSSEPHEEILTCEPEPEVAPTQSMKEPFARPTSPPFVIIIDDTPIGSPLVPSPDIPLVASENPIPSYPQGQAPIFPQ